MLDKNVYDYRVREKCSQTTWLLPVHFMQTREMAQRETKRWEMIPIHVIGEALMMSSKTLLRFEICASGDIFFTHAIGYSGLRGKAMYVYLFICICTNPSSNSTKFWMRALCRSWQFISATINLHPPIWLQWNFVIFFFTHLCNLNIWNQLFPLSVFFVTNALQSGLNFN